MGCKMGHSERGRMVLKLNSYKPCDEKAIKWRATSIYRTGLTDFALSDAAVWANKATNEIMIQIHAVYIT